MSGDRSRNFFTHPVIDHVINNEKAKQMLFYEHVDMQTKMRSYI